MVPIWRCHVFDSLYPPSYVFGDLPKVKGKRHLHKLRVKIVLEKFKLFLREKITENPENLTIHSMLSLLIVVYPYMTKLV